MAQSSLASCSRIDDSFGPHAGDCRGGFDFTLLFEEAILTILPLGLLLLVLPPRVWFLLRRPQKVAAGSYSAPIKLVSRAVVPPCPGGTAWDGTTTGQQTMKKRKPG